MRASDMQVRLPDELLLLALHDEKGSVVPAAVAPLNGALMGAILMELALQGRVQETPTGAIIVDPTPTGDPLSDEVLRRIAEADEPRTPSYWVGRLAGTTPRLKDRLIEGLVARGILERREKRILWIFRSHSYPLVDAAVEQRIRERLRAVVIDGQAPDRRTAALIGLVRACNLIDELFAPHERPHARQRIADLTSEDAARGGLLGGGLEAALMAAMLGATILYAHQAMHVPNDEDSDWSFYDSDGGSTWDTNWSEPSSASDTAGWDGPGSDSGGGDSGGWGDSGGGDSGGGDGGGGGD